jgi:hypothetical protein
MRETSDAGGNASGIGGGDNRHRRGGGIGRMAGSYYDETRKELEAGSATSMIVYSGRRAQGCRQSSSRPSGGRSILGASRRSSPFDQPPAEVRMFRFRRVRNLRRVHPLSPPTRNCRWKELKVGRDNVSARSLRRGS